MKNLTLSEIILIHVKADGPVTMDSIVNYCRLQYGKVNTYEVANCLNDLIVLGEIKLYDDGESFV